MSQNRSRDDLLRFVEYTGSKGLVPTATAAARKAAVNRVTSILSDEEAEDVTNLDLDELMRRFDNLNQHQYTPESLQTYKSRLKTVLEDFRLYRENPLNFRSGSQSRTRVKSNGEKKKSLRTDLTVKESVSGALPKVIQHLPNVTVLPIPLRPDLTVQIAGLPFDLTPAEAKKIANIILAHAMED